MSNLKDGDYLQRIFEKNEMSSLSKILFLLERYRGEFLSGEDLAKYTQVSRNAVWKHINTLKKNAYEICGVNHRGYMLSEDFERISKEGIFANIQKFCMEFGQFSHYRERCWDVDVFDEIDSTNSYLKSKELCDKNARHVAVARFQNGGRGRFGRKFFSPKDSGLYMSVKFSDEKAKKKRDFLTVIAALCVCETMEAVSSESPQIKWVNDVLINFKKVCGILTEATYSLESGELEDFIVGIGINVFYPQEDFPEDIREIAGYLFEEKQIVLNRMIALILLYFEYYLECEDEFILKKYKERCIVIGKRVNVIRAGNTYIADVIDIDESCGLVVELPTGEREILNSGEISLRL